MKSKHLKTLGMAGALCLLGVTAFNAQAAGKDERGQLTAKDYKFVSEAANGGNLEVSLGQIAMEKSADKAVQDFGKQMVDDHKKINKELTDLAAKKGASVLVETSKSDQRLMDRLRGLSGAEFDRAYIDQMVSDHKKDVKEFQKQAKNATDTELQAFVSRNLPTVEEHLRKAETIQATISPRHTSTTPVTPSTVPNTLPNESRKF